jgi:hypothetical protein
MIYRFARLLLEIVGIAIGGALVVAALAIWRLSSAPVEAGFIRPYLEQAINDANLGFAVQLTDAKIDWRGFQPRLDLHFHGVSISGAGGAPVGGFQEGTLGLSVRRLAFGRPGVVTIDIKRPEIHIVRDSDDHFSLRLGPTGGGDGGDFGDIFQTMTAPPNDLSPLGQLRRVRLVDGSVIVDDRKLGISWSAPDVDIDLDRGATQASARIDVTLALPGHAARLLGAARYDDATGKTSLSLNVANFDAAAAAPLAAVLKPLQVLAAPVSGQVHAVLDRAGNLIAGDARLHGDKGLLVLPDYYPQPLDVSSIALDLHLADATRRLILDRLAIDLGEARFTAIGAVAVDGPRLGIDMRVDIAGVKLARFDELWPHGFAVGGRDWVTGHIPDGVINTGSVHIAASGRADDLASIAVGEIKGVFDYTGLEVHYFPPLAPVRAITGHGAFDTSGMTLSIDSGSLGDIAVSGGTVAMTGFDRDDRNIDIALSLDGPLKTALAVLDSPPLRYAHDLGFAPDGVGGRVNARARFAFPLVSTLQFRQVSLGVQGRLEGVSAAGVVGSRDVSAGALAITLDKKAMVLDGKARLSGVPLTLDWRESFDVADPVRSRIGFHAQLSDADRTALGFTPPDAVRLTGAMAVDGKVAIDRKRRTTIDAGADLGGVELSIDRFGLGKAAGVAGKARLSMNFVGDVPRRIADLRIQSKGLDFAGAADFDAEGSFRDADLFRIVTPRNDFAGRVEVEPGGQRAYAISLKGRRLDAAPLINDKSTGKPGDGPSPRLDLTATLDRVLTGKQAGFDSFEGSATLTGGQLERAHLKAVAGGPVTFDYMPEGGSIALHLAAADAGAALAALSLTRGVRGGVLKLDGGTSLAGPSRLTTATLDMQNFRLVDAPIAARLLNAISPTGFVDLLSGQGLAVDRLSARLDYTDGRITLHDGRLAGALGISFEGDVDLDRDKVALKGTVAPVDTFNRILRAIPLIGELTGGSRGGLIGWTYEVKGAADDPKVTVNPLSMFAPGFLRNLFFLGPSQPEAKAAPPAGP